MAIFLLRQQLFQNIPIMFLLSKLLVDNSTNRQVKKGLALLQYVFIGVKKKKFKTVNLQNISQNITVNVRSIAITGRFLTKI